ncbi:MAG: CorA family divalent cation transporter [Steroidobacteraceae bacterium]
MASFSPEIAGSSSIEVGLLCGFHIRAGGGTREIEPRDISAAVADPDGVTWLHFNLSHSRARQLIAQSDFLPEDVRDAFVNHVVHRRVAAIDGGILAEFSDLTFEEGSEPEEVAPLWSFVSDRLLVTGRTHPLQTPDRLRAAVRAGLVADTGFDLLVWLLAQRTSSLRDLANDMSEQVGQIEDDILSGRIREQREQLGRIRRFCAQLRRHFGPDRNAFRRLLQNPQNRLSAEIAEGLRLEVDELSFLVDEVLELYERSKLLQEELASRVAESTGRSLYVLAILSAAFLPMTLITGIFGMNVAGMPGMTEHAAFWRVMLLIVAAGAMTLALISRRDRG